MPIHPQFEISARIPEESDARNDLCADWAELILTIGSDKEEPFEVDLTRAAGEAILETVGDVLHRWAGLSIRDHLWQELDATMDGLMGGTADPDDKGYAQGLAMAIAYMYNPINPDIEQVRADAVERWEDRHNSE
jgi:hypothetical protein